MDKEVDRKKLQFSRCHPNGVHNSTPSPNVSNRVSFVSGGKIQRLYVQMHHAKFRLNRLGKPVFVSGIFGIDVFVMR